MLKSHFRFERPSDLVYKNVHQAANYRLQGGQQVLEFHLQAQHWCIWFHLLRQQLLFYKFKPKLTNEQLVELKEIITSSEESYIIDDVQKLIKELYGVNHDYKITSCRI